ncbi:MAG: thioesterase family protein [Candidatus Eremiobacteraeota bacterium]|nr:thioesterase family protein [Candidatus Eremiobacteraeota bacterium]
MSFDKAVAIAPGADGVFAGHTDARYFNRSGRPFGGYIAAALLGPVLAQAMDESSLISMSADFAAAPHAGPYRIVTRNRRRNRSTDFWTAEFVQDDDPHGTMKVGASMVFARRRPTVEFREARVPDVPPPEERARFDTAQMPSFLSMYDMRVIDGSLLGAASASATRTARTWVRDDPPRPLDPLSLVAFCDTIVPQIFLRAGRMLPTATVTMNVFVHAGAEELAQIGDDYVLTDSTMRIATDGFFDSQSTVWSRAGRLIATTEQLAFYKIPS